MSSAIVTALNPMNMRLIQKGPFALLLQLAFP